MPWSNPKRTFVAATKRPSNAKEEYEKVKVLFDYTKFHIGLYTSLGTIIVTAVNAKLLINYWGFLLLPGIISIGLAGLAGGIVAATLPECEKLGGPSGFFESPTGFFGWKPLRGRTWTRFEHAAFWIGIILVTTSFIGPVVSTVVVPRPVAECST